MLWLILNHIQNFQSLMCKLALFSFFLYNHYHGKFLPSSVPKTEKPLSYEEKLILERNAKRRRTKYKAVHTNKKNYTEVMREVIDGQMKLYEEWCSGSSLTATDPADSERITKNDSENVVHKHSDSEHDHYKRVPRKGHHKSRDDYEYSRRHHSRK